MNLQFSVLPKVCFMKLIPSPLYRWVGACVRPSEGLTRAVLEIYGRDGGTLGEVLGALLELELLQVLEQVGPAVRAFLKEREAEEEEEDAEEAGKNKGKEDVVDAK